MYKCIVLHEKNLPEYLDRSYYEDKYELDNIAYKGNDTYLIILKRYFR